MAATATHMIATMHIEWNGKESDIREDGQGPAVLLLHGYPLDGAMWSGVARALAGSFRVLKPDLPGRGSTPDPASGGIEAYADFVATILESLPAPVGLAGFSMGGYVALALMKRRPEKVKALALVDTRASADDEAGKEKRLEAIAKVRSEGVSPIAEGMIGKMLAPGSLPRKDLLERLRRIMLRQSPQTVEADLIAMRERPDSTAFLSEIAIPTLVVVGEEDALTPPADSRAMADAIPGARLVSIPGAGHMAPMEQPRAVATALADFFGASLGAARVG